jgi:hypothetical protein
MESGREVGHNVYSMFVDIPAGATVTIELDVAGTHLEDAYAIGIPSQPMAKPDLVDVSLTVAGETPVEAEGAGTRLEGRTVRWTGALAAPTRVGAQLDR